MGCLFCNVVERKIPAEIVLENEHTLAFRDIHPVAPKHVLVIPKKHIASVAELTPEDVPLMGQVIASARAIAEADGLFQGGFRLVVNTGDDAGQSVHHVHVHVLGGRPLSWPPG